MIENWNSQNALIELVADKECLIFRTEFNTWIVKKHAITSVSVVKKNESGPWYRWLRVSAASDECTYRLASEKAVADVQLSVVLEALGISQQRAARLVAESGQVPLPGDVSMTR